MNERDKLYGHWPIISLKDLNREAHPGGGTTIRSADSGEGLMEDLYEAQLKGVDIARPEEVFYVASLASALDDAGFSKYAEEVDIVLDHLTSEAEDASTSEAEDASISDSILGEKIRQDLSGIYLLLYKSRGGSVFGSSANQKRGLRLIKRFLVVIQSRPVNWNSVSKYFNQLSDSRLWEGTDDEKGFNQLIGGKYLPLALEVMDRIDTLINKRTTTPQKRLLQRVKELNHKIDKLDLEIEAMVAVQPERKKDFSAILDNADITSLIVFAKFGPALRNIQDIAPEFLVRADAAITKAENVFRGIHEQVYAAR